MGVGQVYILPIYSVLIAFHRSVPLACFNLTQSISRGVYSKPMGAKQAV